MCWISSYKKWVCVCFNKPILFNASFNWTETIYLNHSDIISFIDTSVRAWYHFLQNTLFCQDLANKFNNI